MAITLNKLAVRCEDIALAQGKITAESSSTPLLYDISRNWRILTEASNFRSLNGKWSEKEEAAGEVIISAVTYLQNIGCKNIEQLLKDTIERHSGQNK